MEYVIRRGDKTFTPSKYQLDILKFAREGVGDAFINACAGSSKTTMLENIIYHLPDDKKICFIAFNNSIVDEMKDRIGDTGKDLYITTYHSLAFKILNENNYRRDFVIDPNKYENYLRQNIAKLTVFNEVNSLGNNFYLYYRNIVKLISYARYYHASNIKSIERMCIKYGITLLRDECDVCKRVIDWGRTNLNVIDFTDMVWMVNELNLNTLRSKYDVILIDEAQDTSVMQYQMVQRCKNRGCRMFVVGDKHQSINVWCGSDFDAVEMFKNETTTEFELPISYRCPKKVVRLAQHYSPNIMCDDNAIDGEINYEVSVNSPISGDMVLCRNTAPLINQFQKYLRNNKKCYINGSEDIKKTLIETIDDMKSEYIDINCITQSGLIPKMYLSLISVVVNLLREGIPSEDVYAHSSVLTLYDNINCIKALSDNLSTTEELKNKINVIFSDEDNEGIMLSTIHKAKGLEADNVFILYPSILPNKYVKKEWEKLSEEHIVYVAYTRAKKTLNFIEEDFKTTRTNASFNYEHMVIDIKEKALKLGIEIPLPTTIKKKDKTVNVVVKEKKEKTKKKETTKEFKKGGLKYSDIF